MDKPPDSSDREGFWYEYLTRGDAMERRVRNVLRLLPSGPRCILCAAPFAGAAAPVMRALGKRPADKNPRMCMSCFDFMSKHHGGAEIDGSYLFADIRGSTTLAEGLSAGEFHALLDRFYAVASAAVFAHDGAVDKFVGDEVFAMYFPLMAGPEHARRAVETGEALLRDTGHADPGGPWVPVGVGVHTGRAWVGAVGDEAHTELTAIGDTVNVTARLASAAVAGEVIVSGDAARAAGLDATLERRALDLKGKTTPTEVVSLRIGPAAAPSDRVADRE
jgi:adenylate cyclase